MTGGSGGGRVAIISVLSSPLEISLPAEGIREDLARTTQLLITVETFKFPIFMFAVNLFPSQCLVLETGNRVNLPGDSLGSCILLNRMEIL